MGPAVVGATVVGAFVVTINGGDFKSPLTLNIGVNLGLSSKTIFWDMIFLIKGHRIRIPK